MPRILVFCSRRYGQVVIPGLVPGIHLIPSSGACWELDPGNECRDDTVRTVRVTTLAPILLYDKSLFN